MPHPSGEPRVRATSASDSRSRTRPTRSGRFPMSPNKRAMAMVLRLSAFCPLDASTPEITNGRATSATSARGKVGGVSPTDPPLPNLHPQRCTLHTSKASHQRIKSAGSTASLFRLFLRPTFDVTVDGCERERLFRPLPHVLLDRRCVEADTQRRRGRCDDREEPHR